MALLLGALDPPRLTIKHRPPSATQQQDLKLTFRFFMFDTKFTSSLQRTRTEFAIVDRNIIMEDLERRSVECAALDGKRNQLIKVSHLSSWSGLDACKWWLT